MPAGWIRCSRSARSAAASGPATRMCASCGRSRRSSSAATRAAGRLGEDVLQRRAGTQRLRALRTVLIGRPISTEHEEHERLTKVKALAVFSSDNISSSAYGPEEIMRVLAFAGIGALFLTVQLAALIIVHAGHRHASATARPSRPTPWAPAATSWPATTWATGLASLAAVGAAHRLRGDGGRLGFRRRGRHDLDRAGDRPYNGLHQHRASWGC